MKINQDLLIEELLTFNNNAISSAIRFKELTEKELNWKKDAGQWSILECLEHLNLYGDYYLPEIEKQVLLSPKVPVSTVFKSGVLGNYFANLMKADGDKIKKMKSPKDKNPINSNLSVLTIDRFLKQGAKLETLLKQSQKVDLARPKVPTSLSKMIKIRLGDTLRFYVYHIDRHILQANKNVRVISQGNHSLSLA